MFRAPIPTLIEGIGVRCRGKNKSVLLQYLPYSAFLLRVALNPTYWVHMVNKALRRRRAEVFFFLLHEVRTNLYRAGPVDQSISVTLILN